MAEHLGYLLTTSILLVYTYPRQHSQSTKPPFLHNPVNLLHIDLILPIVLTYPRQPLSLPNQCPYTPSVHSTLTTFSVHQTTALTFPRQPLTYRPDVPPSSSQSTKSPSLYTLQTFALFFLFGRHLSLFWYLLGTEGSEVRLSIFSESLSAPLLNCMLVVSILS